jgi:hypothetical protein
MCNLFGREKVMGVDEVTALAVDTVVVLSEVLAFLCFVFHVRLLVF